MDVCFNKIIDGKIICLYGYTEFGSIYEIKLIPTLLYSWSETVRKNGINKSYNECYEKLLSTQNIIDNGPVML